MPNYINLSGGSVPAATSIPNTFFDEYMPVASGEFVKIYLYLLRQLPYGSDKLTIGSIADTFFMTENDVLRGLRYWEHQKLLSLTFDNRTLTGIRLNPIPSQSLVKLETADIMRTADVMETSVSMKAADAASTAASMKAADSTKTTDATKAASAMKATDATMTSYAEAAGKVQTQGSARDTITGINTSVKLPEKASYSMRDIQSFVSGDGDQLIFIIQQYLGRVLSSTDLNTIYYLYDSLEFSTDLIEYLFEYCVSTGHTNMRYIEKVALAWADQHISTPEEAKLSLGNHNRFAYAVLKTFGLGGRMPAPGEIEYINKWTRTYGFSNDLILEACKRTMMSVHTPSFEYTDRILCNWRDKGLNTLSAIEADDKAYSEAMDRKFAKSTEKAESSLRNDAAASSKNSRSRASSNKFHNFKQRSYDYDALEQKLSQKIRQASGDSK